MSPAIIGTNEIASDADFDLQKWLKELEGAEDLMTKVEGQADSLEAKVDALLAEVGLPVKQESTDKKEEKEPETKQDEK